MFSVSEVGIVNKMYSITCQVASLKRKEFGFFIVLIAFPMAFALQNKKYAGRGTPQVARLPLAWLSGPQEHRLSL